MSAFAIFISEKEIKGKSLTLKAFENVATVEQFQALKLPIISETSSPDATAEKISKAFEINLDNMKSIEKALNVPKLDCFPILWVHSVPSNNEWSVIFA